MVLEGKPYTAEKITDGSSEYHAQKAHIPFVKPFINEKAGDERHKDKADKVAAGRTEELAGAAGKIRKHRKSHESEQQVNAVA